MVEPAHNLGVERVDDRSRQDIRLPANIAVPPDVACGAAVAVLDPNAETLERPAADVRIVTHLIAGEADADAHGDLLRVSGVFRPRL
jgi:hypothetical protein